MQRPQVIAIAATLAGALVLASCGGDDTSAPPTVAPSTTAAPSPTAAPVDTADLVTVAPVDTGDLPPITPLDTSDLPGLTTPPAGPTTIGPTVVDGCPAGAWYLSQTELDSFYDTVGSMTGVAFDAVGDAELDLRPDGTFAYVLDGFALHQDGGGGVQIDLTLTGTIDGTYVARPASLETTTVGSSLTGDATIDGVPTDASEMLQGALGQFPFADVIYRCTGDQLEFDVPVRSATHTIVLTPLG
jgi:hypothetical protein